jgi:hypothetical protein
MPSQDPSQAVSLRDFLEKAPPGTTTSVTDICTEWSFDAAVGRIRGYLALPEITLYCDTAGTCDGARLFASKKVVETTGAQGQLEFLVYQCKNCSKSSKVFALLIKTEQHKRAGVAMKFGESPAFGPPTPARVISLIGPQKELFLKGRRAENQGMGIAAFAYYRRVIEDQKDRIFEEIIKVCKRLSVGQPIVDELTAAKKETQFGKAVDSVKLAIPQALFINGHNPLTLLHSALSEGLHAHTDEECLEIATSIRIVMADLAERMGQALKDEAELNTAVSRLLNKKSVPTKPADPVIVNAIMDVTAEKA